MLKLVNILLYLIALRSIGTHDLKIDYTMETIDRLPLQSDHLPELTGYEFEIVDILGLGPENHGQPKISLKNSASKFLLEVYNDITENEQELDHVREHLTRGRQRRALRDERFITKYDRMEIEKCNNIITFSSKRKYPLKRQDFKSNS